MAAEDWADDELDRKSEVAIAYDIRPGDRWKDQ
jgi:hypothetical protein